MGIGDGISGVIDGVFRGIGIAINIAKQVVMIPLKIIAALPNSVKTIGFALIIICSLLVWLYIWKTRKEFRTCHSE